MICVKLVLHWEEDMHLESLSSFLLSEYLHLLNWKEELIADYHSKSSWEKTHWMNLLSYRSESRGCCAHVALLTEACRQLGDVTRWQSTPGSSNENQEAVPAATGVLNGKPGFVQSLGAWATVGRAGRCLQPCGAGSPASSGVLGVRAATARAGCCRQPAALNNSPYPAGIDSLLLQKAILRHYKKPDNIRLSSIKKAPVGAFEFNN